MTNLYICSVLGVRYCQGHRQLSLNNGQRPGLATDSAHQTEAAQQQGQWAGVGVNQLPTSYLTLVHTQALGIQWITARNGRGASRLPRPPDLPLHLIRVSRFL